MYNRYVPDSNGIYERKTIPDPPKPPPMPVCMEPPEIKQQQNPAHQSGNSGFDLGDLLLLCIVILLLLDEEEADIFPLLIMAAAFLLQ